VVNIEWPLNRIRSCVSGNSVVKCIQTSLAVREGEGAEFDLYTACNQLFQGALYD